METLVSGTKEYLVIKVDDRREQITDLSVLSPTFDVLDKDDTVMLDHVSVDADGLKAYCLVDTTDTPDPWPSGTYRLYLRFDASPEEPLHGPFPFRVERR